VKDVWCERIATSKSQNLPVIDIKLTNRRGI